MSLVNIREALESTLDAMTGIPEIVWENMHYEPTIGTPYLEVLFSPNNRRNACVGVNSPIYNGGLFFIDLFYPENEGPQDADSVAESILTAFEAGSILTANSTTVHIRFAKRDEALRDSPWYHVPITISWYSYN
jgi:hypothetical protein